MNKRYWVTKLPVPEGLTTASHDKFENNLLSKSATSITIVLELSVVRNNTQFEHNTGLPSIYNVQYQPQNMRKIC